MNESNSESVSVTVSRPVLTASSSAGNQRDSQFIIAKCRRNTNVLTNQNTTNQETSDDCEEERILSVYCRSGKLGAAYYTLQTGELFILEEIVDRAPDFQMFLNLFHQVEPARILLDCKMQGAFVQIVKRTVFDNDSNDESRCKFVPVTAKEYSFEACKRRIYSLSLPNEPQNCTDDERLVFLRTVLDFSQIQTVHALGTLLQYLDLNWSKLNMDMQSKPQFLSLKKISLADIVTIDEDTYKGLQIFSSVSHPSSFKKGVQGSNKEGLSLFNIFSKCSSKVGQSRMRVFMRHPTTNIDVLRQRQDVVAFFMKPQSYAIMKNICSSLRFIKNVNGILAKIKALSAKSYQWKSLYNTLYNAVLICEICESAGNSTEYLEQLGAIENDKLYEMALYMNRIIDFDLSKSEGKFTVKAGVDPELDKKKQTMASLHSLMSETAKVELDRLPAFIEECTMLYMPHLGYLLGVKAWAENLTMEQKELPDMKFMNNDYIHYKSKGCEELDMMIGDTYPEIVAHETRIMMRLTAVILENLHTLASVIERCAELDCLITISKVSKEFNYIRPTLTTDNIISIKQGKHPLYITTCDNFVPNDAESSEEAGFIKILTGPNSSGKSVYMKQFGLIIYLAHIGSFVPAEAATIGIIHSIFSRIQSTECVAAHMSAFLIDLRQMSSIVRLSGRGSLVLVDEFGRGTGGAAGRALCAGSLAALASVRPHVMLATHLHDLGKYLLDDPAIRFMSFEYMLDGLSPVFLFRAAAGAGGRSLALAVAARAGLEPHVVARAREIMDAVTNNTLPTRSKKIAAKLDACTEMIKHDLLAEDI